MAIRVLIVDDSATMRALIRMMLDKEADIEVIGDAPDAMEARNLMKALNPDVVTLDIEMPGMNGLDFLEKVMRLRPTPVIIVSTLTQTGTTATVRALELGAVDCYAKPTTMAGDMLAEDNGRLADLVRRAAKANFSRSFQVEPVTDRTAPIIEAGQRIDGGIIAIGASTGGVEALHHLLRRFPADCPPTVITQHINGQFAGAMAKRLDDQCAPKVQLAEPDMPLLPGHIYIAPGNERHFTVRSNLGKPFSRLRPGDLISGHRPSIDMLFNSVAREMPGKAVGVLLTGMGADGAQGLLAMRQAGCPTIAQDQATCVVYGMPKVAAEIGAAQFVLGLPRIADKALGLVAVHVH
jgi:two-component system, chemotaxis family, protein-glutamate methylesterase/glutaminase